jgi:SPP1 family predicted phage head-tail adaptor
MRSARLRHVITLQRPVFTQDAYGEKMLQWLDVATIPAGVEEATSRKSATYQADQDYHPADKRVVMRHRDDVATSWRVVFGAKTLTVGHIDHRDGRNAEMHLLCQWVKEIAP